MHDRDPALQAAIHQGAIILGNVLVRLLFPDALSPVDLSETESAHVTGGQRIGN